MYKCYACGKETEQPGEVCPFCKFPVISTMHGDIEEEKQIRAFAAEYIQANPQYFKAIQSTDLAEKDKAAEKQKIVNPPEREAKTEVHADTTGIDDTFIESLPLELQNRYRELLLKEQKLDHIEKQESAESRKTTKKKTKKDIDPSKKPVSGCGCIIFVLVLIVLLWLTIRVISHLLLKDQEDILQDIFGRRQEIEIAYTLSGNEIPGIDTEEIYCGFNDDDKLIEYHSKKNFISMPYEHEG